MIARDAEPQALQLNSSFVDFQTISFGDELPSVSLDLADVNISSNEFEQLLLQSLKDVPLSLDCLSMDCDGPVQNEVDTQPLSELSNIFAEDSSKRLCNNLNLSAPITETNFISFFQSLSSNSAGLVPTPPSSRSGDITPPMLSGGSTPQSQSRAASPAWSESSGSMSTSSVSGLSCPRKVDSSEGNPLPRHKRPSHRRAEVKRRDKIKTCLDEIKMNVPCLQEKGKLSESAILFKAAEYIHQLKDGFSERGNKTAELRRKIQSLSEEIHSFQEMLPVGGLKQEEVPHPDLDQLYTDWVAQHNKISTKHYIFHSITSSLFDSFKSVMGDVSTFDSMASKLKEWQTRCLSLPVLRKQILNGMLKLTRNRNVVTISKDPIFGSSVDDNS